MKLNKHNVRPHHFKKPGPIIALVWFASYLVVGTFFIGPPLSYIWYFFSVCFLALAWYSAGTAAMQERTDKAIEEMFRQIGRDWN